MARKVLNPGVGQGKYVRTEKECKCIVCGESFMALRSDALRCPKCNEVRDKVHRQRPRPERLKGERSFICIDCGQSFSAIRIAQRCVDCQRLRTNRLNAAGEQKRRKPCIDCGELVYRRTALRCHSCEGKRRTAEGLVAGASNPNWKGGRFYKDGYVHIANPDLTRRKHHYIGEHIVVWEGANGPLKRGWHIHHINGVRDDNRLENLLAMPAHSHHELHSRQDLQAFAAVQEQRIRELEAQLAAGATLKTRPPDS